MAVPMHFICKNKVNLLSVEDKKKLKKKSTEGTEQNQSIDGKKYISRNKFSG